MLFRLKDEELLYRIRLRDPHAVNYLIEKFRLLIYKRAYAFVRSNPSCGLDVEDVISELSIHLIEISLKFDDRKGAQLGRFVQTCLYTRCLNMGRKYQYIKGMISSLDVSVSEDGEKKLLDLLPSIQGQFDPRKQAFIAEEDSLLAKYVYSCSKLEQKIIFDYVEGYKYQEVADRCGCNTKKVDNTIQKVKRKAREIRSVD